jgi:hypothetical protein
MLRCKTASAWDESLVSPVVMEKGKSEPQKFVGL